MSPLYVRFSTERGHYVYDSITNRILRVQPSTYESLPRLLMNHPPEQPARDAKYTHADDSEPYSIVETLRMRYGVLSQGTLKERGSTFDEASVRSAFSSKGVAGCSLELTERCNFRCRYCTYSGGYADQRTHGRRSMDWSVAKSAIDLYLNMNRDVPSERLGIGFYGGEPFLCFPLMRNAIEYAKQHPLARGRNVYFHATTNGSLLTAKIVRYLQANDFGLLVSLDGPRVHHDRHRRFCDGSPTFDTVMQRIVEIHSSYPEYYHRNVSFSVVLAPESNLLDLNDFFSSSILFRDSHRSIRLGSVIDGNPSYAAKHPKYTGRSSDLAQLQAAYYSSHVSGTECSRFIRQLFESAFLKVHRREVIGPEQINVSSPLPICIPGQRKLFVACDGTLHMCEKVGIHLSIGHVTRGIDFHVVTDLLNRYHNAANARECRSCWAHRFCTLCFAKLGKTDSGALMIKRDECSVIRDSMLGVLATYCRAAERNPTAWDYMDGYSVA